MEVILLEDIEALGHEGDIVRVADGHARNYLIPRKLAVQATRASKAELERRRGAIARREEHKAHKARELVDRLHQTPLVIHARSGEGGRLHGTVTAQQIAVALAEQAGLEIDRRRIELPAPIREVGDYLVTAQIYKGVQAQLTITVVAQGGGEKEAPDEEEEAEEEQDVETEDESEDTDTEDTED